MGSLFGRKSVFGSPRRENVFQRMRRQKAEARYNKAKREATRYGVDPEVYYAITSNPELRKYIGKALHAREVKYVKFYGNVGTKGEWQSGMIDVYDSSGKVITKLRVKNGELKVNENELAVIKAISPNAFDKILDLVNKQQQSNMQRSLETQYKFQEAKRYVEEVENRTGVKLTPEQKKELIYDVLRGKDITQSKAYGTMVVESNQIGRRTQDIGTIKRVLEDEGYKVVGGYSDIKKGEILLVEKDNVKYQAEAEGNEYVLKRVDTQKPDERITNLPAGYSKLEPKKLSDLSQEEVREGIVEYGGYIASNLPQYAYDVYMGNSPATLNEEGKSIEERFKRMEEFRGKSHEFAEYTHEFFKRAYNRVLDKIPEESTINATLGVLEKPIQIKVPSRKITEVGFEVPNVVVSYFIAGIPAFGADIGNAITNTQKYSIETVRRIANKQKITDETYNKMGEALYEEIPTAVVTYILWKGNVATKYLSKPLKIISPELEASLVRFGETKVGGVVKRAMIPTTVSATTFLAGEPPEKAIGYGLAAGFAETFINSKSKRVRAKMAVSNLDSGIELWTSDASQTAEIRKATDLMRKIEVKERMLKSSAINPKAKEVLLEYREELLGELKGLGKEYVEEYLLYKKNPSLYKPIYTRREIVPGFYEGLEGQTPKVEAYLKGRKLHIQVNEVKGESMRYKMGRDIRETLTLLKESPEVPYQLWSKTLENIDKVTNAIADKIEGRYFPYAKIKPRGIATDFTLRANPFNKDWDYIYGKTTRMPRKSMMGGIYTGGVSRGKQYYKTYTDVDIEYTPVTTKQAMRMRIKEDTNVIPKAIMKEQFFFVEEKPVTKTSLKPKLKQTTKAIQKAITKTTNKITTKSLIKTTEKPIIKQIVKTIQKPVIKSVIKTIQKPVVKTIEKPVIKEEIKTIQKTVEKPVIKETIKAIILPSFKKKKVKKKSKRKKKKRRYKKSFFPDITYLFTGVGSKSVRGFAPRGVK